MQQLEQIQMYQPTKRWDHEVVLPRLDLPYNKWTRVRIIGGVYAETAHWLQIRSKQGAYLKVPSLCRNQYGRDDCVLCREASTADASTRYIVHCINRADGKLYFLLVPRGALTQLSGLAGLNNGNSVTDPDHGRDVYLRRSNTNGKIAWTSQMSDPSPLTAAERNLALTDFDEILTSCLPSVEQQTSLLQKSLGSSNTSDIPSEATLVQLAGVANGHAQNINVEMYRSNTPRPGIDPATITRPSPTDGPLLVNAGDDLPF